MSYPHYEAECESKKWKARAEQAEAEVERLQAENAAIKDAAERVFCLATPEVRHDLDGNDVVIGYRHGGTGAMHAIGAVRSSTTGAALLAELRAGLALAEAVPAYMAYHGHLADDDPAHAAIIAALAAHEAARKEART